MPSEYDILLQEPQTGSEYDILLAPTSFEQVPGELAFPIEGGGRFANHFRPFLLRRMVADAHAGGSSALETGDLAEGVVLNEGVKAAELTAGALP